LQLALDSQLSEKLIASGEYRSASLLWDISYELLYQETTELEKKSKTVPNYCYEDTGYLNLTLDKIYKLSLTTGILSNPYLLLVWTLFLLNQHVNRLIKAPTIYTLPESLFEHQKIALAYSKQMEDNLAICSAGKGIPSWCSLLSTNCQFLFPFPPRKNVFRLRAMGILRASTESNEVIRRRLPKIKFRVDREKIVESAKQVLQRCTPTPRVSLDIEFAGDPGIGSGPTREFYTLVSEQLQFSKLELWLHSENHNYNKEADHVFHEAGLFPQPISLWRPNYELHVQKTCELFKLVGQFVAKGLSDDQIVNITFSVPFLKLLLGLPVGISDLISLRPSFGNTIAEFLEVIKAENTSEDKWKEIEDTFLTFSLAEGDLVENGAAVDVTRHNLSEYVSSVFDFFFGSGINRQLEAFKEGFQAFIPLENLQFFYPHELNLIISGAIDAPWDKEDMRANFEFTDERLASKTLEFLLETLSEFNARERKLFLHFTTGCERLPIGGFKNMKPRFVVIRKNTTTPDSEFPLANTFFSKFFVPDYSTKEVLKNKIIHAMNGTDFQFDRS